MSQAPHLLEKSRAGFKYGGDVTLRDHMAFDGLYDIFTDQAMGNLTESANSGGAVRLAGGAGRVRGGLASEGGPGVEGRGGVRRGGGAGVDPAAQG